MVLTKVVNEAICLKLERLFWWLDTLVCYSINQLYIVIVNPIFFFLLQRNKGNMRGPSVLLWDTTSLKVVSKGIIYLKKTYNRTFSSRYVDKVVHRDKLQLCLDLINVTRCRRMQVSYTQFILFWYVYTLSFSS